MPKRSRLALIAGLGAALGIVGLAATLLAEPPQRATYLGSYTWKMEHPAFGGLSALELDADGLTFTALSDRGAVLVGQMSRDDGGAVTGTQAAIYGIRGTDGQALSGPLSDAEGLAIAPDGRVFMSFEHAHRVWSYPALSSAPIPLPGGAVFEGLQRNSGLEALAIDRNGHLYTLPERSGSWTQPFPVWRWDGAAWTQAFTLPRDGKFLPVGADFGPDGHLYLLEREFRGFRGLFGFRTRVSRFAIGPSGPGPRETLVETRPHRHDNLEGIAVWRDDTGAIRLTLLSDDNFNPFQRTQIVDYRVPD